jgi:hypothetical protein
MFCSKSWRASIVSDATDPVDERLVFNCELQAATAMRSASDQPDERFVDVIQL